MQSIHNFLSNVPCKQTYRQTDKQTNATKTITFFAMEVMISEKLITDRERKCQVASELHMSEMKHSVRLNTK